MKKLACAISLIVIMLALQAHEFWLEPMKFRLQPGEATTIKFAVGDNFTGGDWDLSRHKAAQVILHENDKIVDLTSKVPSVKGEKLKLTMNNSGVKMLAMSSNQAFIKLNGKQFNEYLKSDGLEEAIAWRSKNKQDTLGAKEFYTRYAKLLLQVGDKVDNTWSKIIGQRLEVIPLQNPNGIKSGDYLTCKLLYEGKPSPHTMVKVWGHVGNKIFLQEAYTEDDGTVKFPISANGPWMVSAVKMVRSKNPKADWESSWASLLFSVE